MKPPLFFDKVTGQNPKKLPINEWVSDDVILDALFSAKPIVTLGDHDTILLNNGRYEIELSRIPDPKALVNWIHHLLKKNWVTSDTIRQFIECVYESKGWDLYRNQK
jgi:hypothetical protein